MAFTGSQTDILNYALVSVLGDAPIDSPTDNTKSAKTLSKIYNIVRQSELRKRYWKFSLTRSLLPSVTPPVSVCPNGIPSPYAYAYQIPNNCLRLIDFAGMRQNLGMINYRTGLEKFYDWQGNYIFTSLGTGTTWSQAPPATSQWAHYVQDITDTTQFDSNFSVAFACALGAASAMSITQSIQKFEKAQSDYNKAIADAAVNNAIERLPEGIADDSYILSRL